MVDTVYWLPIGGPAAQVYWPVAWSKGRRRRPPGAVLYSSREPSELSQWLCYDDSTSEHYKYCRGYYYYYYYYYYANTSLLIYVIHGRCGF